VKSSSPPPQTVVTLGEELAVIVSHAAFWTQHVDLSTRAHAAPAHLVELAEPIKAPVKASSPPQTAVKLGEVPRVIVSQLTEGTQQRDSSLSAHVVPAQKAPAIKTSTTEGSEQTVAKVGSDTSVIVLQRAAGSQHAAASLLSHAAPAHLTAATPEIYSPE
jgi:hypothetical protein